MRHPLRPFLLLLALGACVGVTAREEALMPAMVLGWRTISTQVEHQASTEAPAAAAELRAQSAAMATALASGDREQVIGVDWAMLFFAAVAGIEHRVTLGEIGSGVAVSLRETVDRFNVSYLQLLQRTP